VALEIARSPTGAWTVGGQRVTSLDGCDDVDLSFSPATNLLPLRRLSLAVGESAAARAAWVQFPDLTTEVLEQVYTRLSPERYLYESADGSFRRVLTVDAVGFVSDYPDLWHAEARSGSLEPSA
jgi:Uncharacterized protein conserved in bacteria